METILDISGLTMRFGGLVAVSDFDLQMEKGELVGLIGPNGSGKTTVFNMISGFYRPTAGSILFEGKDMVGLRPDQVVASGVARIFQNNRLFTDFTVYDNVMLSQHVRMKASPAAAVLRLPIYARQEAEAHETAMGLLASLGLKAVAHEQAGSLPYGLQRKVEVARALATKPRLLLLDEPATGMSVEEVTDMMDFILRIQEEFSLTILLVEHTMRVVMGCCPRMLVLNYGKTICKGTPEQVQCDPQVITAYLGEEGGQ